jgi:hypothetical protein
MSATEIDRRERPLARSTGAQAPAPSKLEWVVAVGGLVALPVAVVLGLHQAGQR